MPNEELLYIEDTLNRKLFYRFTPPAFVSNFVPLIIVLDEKAMNFEYKMWNVLTPLYNVKDENRDSYQSLFQELIKQISQEHECEDYIYLCAIGEDDKNIEDFVEQCKKEGINIQLSFCPNIEIDGLKKLLDRFDRMTP